MDERRIMKYQLTTLSLQGIVNVAVTSIIESLSKLILPKSSRKLSKNLSKVGSFVVSEIVSGAIGGVIEDEMDQIKNYYSKMEENDEQSSLDS